MKKLILFFFTLFTLQSFAQTRIKKYVLSHVNVVKTISPDSLNFSDLEVIGEAIGSSRVVMLGEQDHGDAPTFLAKTRLIKYLHERKGFNILAFEDDFFSLEKGWDKTIEEGLDISTFLKYNITKLWVACDAFENLFYSYIPKTIKTSKPLKVTGFDSQIYRSFSKYNLKKFIHDYLTRQDIPFIKSSIYADDFTSHLNVLLESTDLVKSRKFESALKVIFEQLLPKEDSASFEMIILKNLETTNKIVINRISGVNDQQLRDEQMAYNLKWLMKYKYPNEKIIVWAHSAHLAKNTELIQGDLSIRKSMGSFFTLEDSIRKSTYIIGFSSRNGTAGRITLNKKFNVQRPKNSDFESWFPKEMKYGFVDFRTFNLKHPEFSEPFNMKGIAHSHNLALWNKVFDGVFYVRDMYPCEEIKRYDSY